MITKNKKIIDFEKYDAIEALPEEDRELVNSAIQIAKTGSYSPYSKFRVGAALQLDNGKIICGSNQENMAYPSGICAERTAIFYANSEYPEAKILSLAIVAIQNGELSKTPVYPCGSCRQVMSESELRGAHPIRVIMCGKEKTEVVSEISSLLPFRFDSL